MLEDTVNVLKNENVALRGHNDSLIQYIQRKDQLTKSLYAHFWLVLHKSGGTATITKAEREDFEDGRSVLVTSMSEDGSVLTIQAVYKEAQPAPEEAQSENPRD